MDEPMRERLVAAAKRWGTPLYVTDLDAAAAGLDRWRRALPGALVAYAVKANPDPALLRRLVDEGAGCEVTGPVELALAVRAGCPPQRTVVNGVGLTDAQLAEAARGGALVNVESAAALDAPLSIPGARVGLRINPEIGAATHPHLATGAASAKFGVALDELPAALSRIRAAGLGLASIGAHVGSNVVGVDAFAATARVLAEVTERAAAAGLAPERIDLGGGLADARPATLAAYAAAVRRHLPDLARLTVEPGRSIVAPAGWLVARVVRAQRRAAGALHLVADAGMTELLRPALYGARHPVRLLAPGAALPPVSPLPLSGPVCEAGDVLHPDLLEELTADEATRAGPGALLAIGEAGAYGLAMASNYNGRLRPAQVVVEGGVARLSVRRETLDDVVARDA